MDKEKKEEVRLTEGRCFYVKKMKLFSYIMAIILVMSVVFVPVMASAADSSNPRITFGNSQINQPDLYITKTVTSSAEGYTIPNTTFTFILQWDLDGDGILSYASNELYYVYDANGSLVSSDSDLYTDEYGRFTLTAGQTAKFEYVGKNVAYQVTEVPVDNFTQTVPAGEQPAAGTVDKDGTLVEFTNTYYPPDTTTSEPTEIYVYKSVYYPTGYEVPVFDDDFTFSIEVDGELYANQSYTVYDSSTDEEVTIYGDDGETEVTPTTDSNGQFTLKAGQYAVFTDIATGSDYVISEISSSNSAWTLLSSSNTEGAAAYPGTYVYFTNSTASFIVTKSLYESSDSDQAFTFTVTDENGSPIANLEYYLYDDGYNLLYSSALTTNDNGQFTLKAGQRAVFVGLPVGTVYNVTEESVKNYTVVTPESGSYTSQTVSEIPQTLTFVNTNHLGSITVNKYENNGTTPLSGVSFELRKLDGTLVGFKTTGEDGTITFSDLLPGTYVLTETKTASGYTLLQGSITVEIPLSIAEDDLDSYTTEDGEEIDTSKAVEVTENGDTYYYFYDLTYKITNGATLDLPMSGGTSTLLWIVLISGVALVLTGGVLLLCRRKKPNGSNMTGTSF